MNRTFYIDSNSLGFEKRVRNEPQYYYPESDIFIEEFPIEFNYYPITSTIFFGNQSWADMGVMVDRSQGASSILEHSLEFMINRKVMTIDLGKMELLEDAAVQHQNFEKLTHQICFNCSLNEIRKNQFRNENPLFLMYAKVDKTTKIKPKYSETSHNLNQAF